MDGTDDLTSPDTARPPRNDHADIRSRFAAVLQPAPEEPVDVSAYLLHPPPSASELERRDRRRLVVRWGSLAAAGVLGVVLLVPMPGRDASPDEHAPSGARVEAVADEAYPQRVDVPPEPAAARRAAPRQASRTSTVRHGAATPRTAPAIRRRAVVIPVRPRPAAHVPVPPARAPQAGSQQAASGAQSASAGGVESAPTGTPTSPSVEGATSSSDAPTIDEGVGTSGSRGSSG